MREPRIFFESTYSFDPVSWTEKVFFSEEQSLSPVASANACLENSLYCKQCLHFSHDFFHLGWCRLRNIDTTFYGGCLGFEKLEVTK